MKKILSILLACAFLMLGLGAYAETNQYDGMFDDLEDTVTISRDEYESLLLLKESVTGGFTTGSDVWEKYEKIEEIYEYIRYYYYTEPDYDKMMEYAIQGMLTALDDPYTFYYNEADWADMWEEDTGEYAGVGLQLLGNYSTNIVTISRVFKDTPSEQAGLRKGDILKRVDDLTVTAYTMEDAVAIMRGGEGETVELEVERRGETLIFTLSRAVIKINWIESTMLDNQVGYICLYEFSGDCAGKFEEAVKELEAQGATALIIDLRDNGGGWVTDAVSIADIFLDKTMLIYAEDRYGNREEYWTKDGSDSIPLIVMVNEGSASSSEILSGGLQDLGRAKLVGVQSYGKGIMQSVVTLSGEKDGFQFTVAQYFLPSGTKVHKVGITPDVIVEMPEELVGEYFELGDMTDPQLKAAWEEAIKLRDGENK